MIPTELTELPQWVVWKYEDRGAEKPTKPPYNPKTGYRASVTDPSTWGTYAQAWEALQSGLWAGMGFVLTASDPYTFIDFDGVYDEGLVNGLNTYTEISPSGRGLHLVTRGSVPEGRRAKGVEIYCQSRYMTLTGNVWPEFKPIRDANGTLTALWESLDTGKGEGVAGAPLPALSVQADEVVYHVASQAVNGEKFTHLWAGNWQAYYPSQSEADFALVNILGFYSRDAEQIKRMFWMSELGQRPKAHRADYLDSLVKKSFDNLLPEITFTPPPLVMTPDPPIDMPTGYAFPEGWVGEIARYIYQQSPKPTIEVSLAGALCLMAGICGRNWNVLGNGLNIYVIVIAETGVGKEAANSGISKLAKACPNLDTFIGPAKLESGQGLIAHLKVHPCHVVLQGEFGLTLKNLASPKAGSTLLRLRGDLLDIYGKSGAGDTLGGSARSKAENSTGKIQSPALTILAESSPEVYLEAITQEAMQYGLLPRFTTIVHKGMPQESDSSFNPPPVPSHIVEYVDSLAAYAIKNSIANQPVKVVSVSLDDGAKRLWQEFEHRNVVALGKPTQAKEMYSRATMKATKLAALVAIGVNYLSPQITESIMQWAIGVTAKDTEAVIGWFDKGDTGDPTNETKRMEILYTIIKDYYAKGLNHAKAYGVTEEIYKTNWIPQSYLYRRCSNLLAFRNYRNGVSGGLSEILQAAVDGGQLLVQGPKVYRSGVKLYAPGPTFSF